MADKLQPGDRVLDLRAVTRSGGVFTGLVVAPIAGALSGWWWGWCVLAAVVYAFAGFLVATAISRFVFPAPPGQTVVTRVGPAALGVAVRASVAGGLIIFVVGSFAAFLGAGNLAAVVVGLIGLAVSVGAGCLAALL